MTVFEFASPSDLLPYLCSSCAELVAIELVKAVNNLNLLFHNLLLVEVGVRPHLVLHSDALHIVDLGS